MVPSSRKQERISCSKNGRDKLHQNLEETRGMCLNLRLNMESIPFMRQNKESTFHRVLLDTNSGNHAWKLLRVLSKLVLASMSTFLRINHLDSLQRPDLDLRESTWQRMRVTPGTTQESVSRLSSTFITENLSMNTRPRNEWDRKYACKLCMRWGTVCHWLH